MVDELQPKLACPHRVPSGELADASSGKPAGETDDAPTKTVAAIDLTVAYVRSTLDAVPVPKSLGRYRVDGVLGRDLNNLAALYTTTGSRRHHPRGIP